MEKLEEYELSRQLNVLRVVYKEYEGGRMRLEKKFSVEGEETTCQKIFEEAVKEGGVLEPVFTI